MKEFDMINNLSTVVQQTGSWKKIYEEQMNAINRLSGMSSMLNEIGQIAALTNDLIPKQTRNIASALGDSPFVNVHFSSSVISEVLSTQIQAMIEAQQSICTPEITQLLDSFQKASWPVGMSNFVQSISTGYTSAANIALLKNTKALVNMLDEGYPSQLKPLLNKMHKRTGQQLSKCDGIEVCVATKSFRTSENSEGVTDVGIEGMNIIASSTELFADITENEMMSFLDVLSNYRELALEHPVGKKIFNIILSWNNFMDFDHACYYHARSMRKNGLPYTSDEMGRAPREVVECGRYNHMYESAYYFSDTKEGAVREVKIHNLRSSIQTARLWPVKPIKMIDFSEEIKNKNLFLDSLRYEVTGNDKQPKEYLLPEFVATCCKMAAIEGIKYYGTKEYKNYVTWGDYYFDVDMMRND